MKTEEQFKWSFCHLGLHSLIYLMFRWRWMTPTFQNWIDIYLKKFLHNKLIVLVICGTFYRFRLFIGLLIRFFLFFFWLCKLISFGLNFLGQNYFYYTVLWEILITQVSIYFEIYPRYIWGKFLLCLFNQLCYSLSPLKK